jgi:hypothetical protein
MAEDHVHMWGPYGCWCGAKQCVYTPATGRCQNAAALDSGSHCEAHKLGTMEYGVEGWKDATFGG